jgi:ATP-dependent Zn protease
VRSRGRSLLATARARAGEILERHRPTLDRLIARLRERETIERPELAALLSDRPAA